MKTIIQWEYIEIYLCKILYIEIIYKMLTVSNLAQRQKQAIKNVDETFKQMRRVPVGGYGALIQRPNQKSVKQNITPTLFTTSPMSSSLPYLSENVKFRSNINQLLMQEHINTQRVNAKASLDFDKVKMNEYEDKKIDNMILQDIHAPNTKELMKRYLSGEIKQRQEDEVGKEIKRQERVDAAIYETPPIVHQHIPEMTRGDLGTNEGGRQDILRSVLQAMRQQASRSDLISGLKEYQSREISKELLRPEYRSKVELQRSIDELRAQGVQLPTGNEIQSKEQKIEQIIKGRARGQIKIDIPSKSQRERRDYLANEARLNGDDGGGLAFALKANLQ